MLNRKYLWLMRHIINLIGPPAAGKSTIIQELKRLLPFYEVLAIDDFRQRLKVTTPEEENTAWNQLWMAALKADYCILESTGTSPQLSMMLDRLWRAPGTNILTVALLASPRTCRQRDTQRLREGHQSFPLLSEPKGQRWKPLSELSVSMSLEADKLPAAQLAALLRDQLPPDFID